jgi:hypothetical protein
MKLVTATLGTAALLVLFGIAPAAHSRPQDQDQQQDKPKPQKPPQQKPVHPATPPAEHPKTEQHPQDQQKQQDKDAQKSQQQQQKDQQKAQQQQQKEQQKATKTQQKQEQQQNAASSHRHSQPANGSARAQQAPSERGGGGGQPARGNPQQTAHYEQAHLRQYHPQHGERIVQISQEQFQAQFGQAHTFNMPGPPMMVGGFPRFQYSGFWFVLEEPWPNYWVDNDEFYIVFDGGLYWLCDYNDPGVQIELVVITV